MIYHKILNKSVPFVLALSTFLLLIGCKNKSGLQLGQEIPSGQQSTRLSDILANPSGFNGKTVVMNGTITGQCPSLCEFFYQEGVHKATIFPQGFNFPKLETGKKVTVYAGITSGAGNVVFSALGIRTE